MLELIHMGPQSSHQLSLIDQTITITIYTREYLSQFLPLILGYLLQGEV